jgi:hypothetical protein
MCFEWSLRNGGAFSRPARPEHERPWKEFVGEFLAAGERIIPAAARNSEEAMKIFSESGKLQAWQGHSTSHVPSTLFFLWMKIGTGFWAQWTFATA